MCRLCNTRNVQIREHALARDSLTRISRSRSSGVVVSSGDTRSRFVISALAERERERERDRWRNDELLDPDRALLAPGESAMPECRCQIEFLPYAASRDKYDRKIFAIYSKIRVCTLGGGWGRTFRSRSSRSEIENYLPSPFLHLHRERNLSNVYDKYRATESRLRNIQDVYSLARSSGTFQFHVARRRFEIKTRYFFFSP